MAVALIVAGGSGRRMKMDVRKQYLMLDGLPVLMHTLATFCTCDEIESIVLAVPSDDIAYCRNAIVDPLDTVKDIQVVAGGKERQQSVYNGLCSMSVPSDEIVLIHDGVRPFVDEKLIRQCIQSAASFGAAILAVPVSDTIKQSDAAGTIKKTVARDCLWSAQTPQAFRYDWIREAHEKALINHVRATDDASLVEDMGRPVKLVPGSRTNLKITTPEDLAIASALIKR